ncbi:hypothetical protein J9332_38135, partial [Aquimarina celericrescens]|nr:hypothetical protein [Aquimarina celericrescens]
MLYYIIGAILFITLLFVWFQYKKTKKELKNKDIELQSLVQETDKQLDLQQDLISILSQELRTPLYG